MALNDKVLKEYFSTNNKPLFQNKNRFRVFDDPPIDKRETPPKNLDSNAEKTRDKPETNQRQNKDKTEDKPKTNWRQTGDNLYFKKNKLETEPETTTQTNQRQIGDKPETIYRFSSLVGLQREIVLFLFESVKLSGLKITLPITVEHIAKSCNIIELSVKKTLQRLEKKYIIYRYEYKVGRGGWTRYSLPENIYQELLQNESQEKLRTNRRQTGDKPETKLGTEPETSSPSSSSLDNNINTTTTGDTVNNFQSLPSEWDELDFSELQKRGVLFTRHHLINLFPFLKSHSAFDFQESIDGYVYDIDNNFVDAKKGKLNMLIGIIRNNQLYVSSHYESENRKKIKEIADLVKIRKEEENLYKTALEDEQFNQWLKEYGKDNIKKQLPTGLLVSFDHGDKPALDWIKTNIYQPGIKK